MDEIQQLWNQIIYQEGLVDICKSAQVVQQKFLGLKSSQHSYDSTLNVDPWIKVNVDAAQLGAKASLALVARDHKGEVISVWGQCQCINSPFQAEVVALQWAVETAIREKWQLAMIKSDAKACIGPIINPISNIQHPSASFNSIIFFWVRRNQPNLLLVLICLSFSITVIFPMLQSWFVRKITLFVIPFLFNGNCSLSKKKKKQ